MDPASASAFDGTKETLGGLRLGLSEAEIIAVVGAPTEASETKPNDGWTPPRSFYKRLTWKLPDGEASVSLQGDAGAPLLASLIQTTSSRWATSRGLKVGQLLSKAVAAYGDPRFSLLMTGDTNRFSYGTGDARLDVWLVDDIKSVATDGRIASLQLGDSP